MVSDAYDPLRKGMALLFEEGSVGGLDDAVLLERFAARRDEAAFEALVVRHGGMVLRVCRALLADRHDAEDAFQATFLVLARRARSLRQPERLASWLYGVATRTARKANAHALLRRRRETGEPVPAIRDDDAPTELVRCEEAALLHEEIARLPEVYRSTVVLCALEGQTHEEAARRLRRPVGTISARLARAREILRRRLVRRGVASSTVIAALAAGESAAAMPALLAARTARTAVSFAHGLASDGGAAALAESVLRQSGRIRLITLTSAGLLATALTAAGLVVLNQRDGAAEPPGRRVDAEKQPPRPVAVDPVLLGVIQHQEGRVNFGAVQDFDGRAVQGVEVAALARAQVQPRPFHTRTVVLGQATTDTAGRFNVSISRARLDGVTQPYLLAALPGRGLVTAPLPDGDRTPANALRLEPEQQVPVQLIDLEGRGAVGIRLRVVNWTRDVKPGWERMIQTEPAAEPVRAWPGPFTTGPEGQFVLRGFGRDHGVLLEVEDDRFARARLPIETGHDSPPRYVKLVLEPARPIEGRVTHESTGEPAANIRLVIRSRTARQNHAEGITDAAGRFRINAFPEPARYEINAFPPEGSQDLPAQTELRMKPRPPGELAIALVRGVRVHGRVTEIPGNRPVASCAVNSIARRVNNPNYRSDVASTGPDGRFTLVVPPGAGHLVVLAPSHDYLHVETSLGALNYDKPGSVRMYPDGLVPLDVALGADPPEITIVLRRGVTRKGRVFDPAGRPVVSATLSSLSYRPPISDYFGQAFLPVRDGRFELPGCDSDRPATVYILDAEHKLGARAELRGGAGAGELPPTIRLQPCGAATVRFLRADGSPLPKHQIYYGRDPIIMLELLVTPGVSVVPPSMALRADVEYAANFDFEHRTQVWTDEQGRVTLEKLIPGASYRIVANQARVVVTREFSVGPGEILELGDVTIKE